MLPLSKAASLALGLSLWIAACSSSNSSGGADSPPPSDGGVDASQHGQPDAAPADAAPVDSGPTIRMGVHYHTAYTVNLTGTNYCATDNYWGDSCGTCNSGPASPGVAAVYDGRSSTPSKFNDCNAVPATPDGGPLDYVDYCCETPFIDIEGPVSPPKSCNEVCGAQGLICTTTAPVQGSSGVIAGTAFVLYDNSEGVAMYHGYKGCDAVPDTQESTGDETLSLRTHRCACADPHAVLPSPP